MPPKSICFRTARPTLDVARAKQDCVVVPKVATAIVATRIVFLLMMLNIIDKSIVLKY